MVLPVHVWLPRLRGIAPSAVLFGGGALPLSVGRAFFRSVFPLRVLPCRFSLRRLRFSVVGGRVGALCPPLRVCSPGSPRRGFLSLGVLRCAPRRARLAVSVARRAIGLGRPAALGGAGLLVPSASGLLRVSPFFRGGAPGGCLQPFSPCSPLRGFQTGGSAALCAPRRRSTMRRCSPLPASFLLPPT